MTDSSKRKMPWDKKSADEIRAAMEAAAIVPAPTPDESIIATPFGPANSVSAPPQIAFGNPIWRSGLNITVRRGTKWEGTRGTAFATTVLGLPVTPIEVVDTIVFRFSELEVKESRSPLLLLEHDQKCRNYFGLLKEMRSVYDKFDPSEEVTVVFFLVAEEE